MRLLYAFQQSNCAKERTQGGMFRKIVCGSADAGCTWFINISRIRNGGIGDWYVTSKIMSHENCIENNKQLKINLVLTQCQGPPLRHTRILRPVSPLP